jgi:hypothetical protein
VLKKENGVNVEEDEDEAEVGFSGNGRVVQPFSRVGGGLASAGERSSGASPPTYSTLIAVHITSSSHAGALYLRPVAAMLNGRMKYGTLCLI